MCTECPADRLLTEWSFLRILLLNSVDEKVHDSLCTNARSSDLGPTLLRQLLQQAGGSHTITIENYERTFKETKLTAIDGCNMQTYADHIVPVINSLHRLRRFPLNATKTMLENTAGTHNESFQMIRTTALAQALAVDPVEVDEHPIKTFAYASSGNWSNFIRTR